LSNGDCIFEVEYIKYGGCILGTKLLKNTNRKQYTVRMVTLLMTLSDLWPDFKVNIFRHWISQKQHEIEPHLL